MENYRNRPAISLPEQQRAAYLGFQGEVTDIIEMGMNSREYGCNKLMQVEDSNGQIVNFVVSWQTYFLNGVKINVGDEIVGFYNANAPAILIYPPQFHAEIIVLLSPGELVKVDYFDENLLSSDGMLRIMPDGSTEIISRNGQDFTADLGDRNLIVTYSRSTRSIPAQAVPEQIVVMC